MFEPPSNPPQRPIPDELYVAWMVAEGKAAERLRKEQEGELNAMRVLLRLSQIQVGQVCSYLRAWGYSRRQIAEMLGNRNPQYDESVYVEDLHSRG